MNNYVNIINSSQRKFIANKKIKDACERALKGENITDAEINIVLLNDSEIHKMNKEYLEHDYPTDVISFMLEETPLTGEVYISVDTAEMQSKDYKVSLTNELTRLAVHGTLHIIGYDDIAESDRTYMSNLEDKYLNAAQA